MRGTLDLRAYAPAEPEVPWRMLEPVFRAGKSYDIDPDMSRDVGTAYWTGPDRRVFVVSDGARLFGTFYIVRHQKGGDSHVCACGDVTAAEARGRGVARRMLAHSLEITPKLGFRAMQFNFFGLDQHPGRRHLAARRVRDRRSPPRCLPSPCAGRRGRAGPVQDACEQLRSRRRITCETTPACWRS